jgi:hypothetical protein
MKGRPRKLIDRLFEQEKTNQLIRERLRNQLKQFPTFEQFKQQYESKINISAR